eukprot:886258-Pleurochrysis_carterae.AAC.4
MIHRGYVSGSIIGIPTLNAERSCIDINTGNYVALLSECLHRLGLLRTDGMIMMTTTLAYRNSREHPAPKSKEPVRAKRDAIYIIF